MDKKIISILLVFLLVIGQSSFLLAQNQSEKIDWLLDRGIVRPDPRGYRLDEPIKRSELAAMITRALYNDSTAILLKNLASNFEDVQIDHWANGYINYVASANFINGYPDNTFKPDSNISYAELIKTLVMVLNPNFQAGGDSAGFWATPYIVKAIEEGILKGIQIQDSDYNSLASREKTFHMIYNTISQRMSKDRENYKVIVVENSRTGDLDSGQVQVLVMEPRINSTKTKLRYKKNDKINIDLPLDLYAETLLGMVLDISIDKDDNLKDLTLDQSFQYYKGPFAAYDSEVMLNDGRKYKVVDKLIQPYKTEKLYGLYYNDKEMEYKDYVRKNDRLDGSVDGTFMAEFARLTIKDEEIYFIDAFSFEEIAPVKRLEEFGEKIILRADHTADGEKEVILESVFAFKDGAFITIEKKDISKDSLLHIYDKRAIVKLSNSFSGLFQGIVKKEDIYYVKISDELFQIRNSDSKRPVYSLDGDSYSTIYDSQAKELLKDLKNSQVLALLDLNDHLQLLKGQID